VVRQAEEALMDWYQEGVRWMDRWFTPTGYALYGPYSTTHLRALLRLTDTSQDWLAAKRGFYDRMREINNLPMRELDSFIERQRNG
jgi:hypothetical protein